MGISEALIIYLAIGTPLGVYAIVRAKSSIKQELIALLTVNILFWPVFASLEFVPKSNSEVDPKYFVESRPVSSFNSQSAVAAFNASVEALGDRGFRREVLRDTDRFVALSEAISPQVNPTRVIEFFEIANHSNASLATKCLVRKNLRKLEEHRDRAFTDLGALGFELSSDERSEYLSSLETLRHSSI